MTPDSAPSVKLEIRGVTTADREVIRAVGRDAFAEYGSYDRYLLEWLGAPGVHTFVGELAGAFAGVAMVLADEVNQRGTELIALAVLPAFQGRGIGTGLLRRVLDFSAAQGAKEIHLSVAEANARAQRLFAREGFRKREGVGLYPAGQRALLMTKELKTWS